MKKTWIKAAPERLIVLPLGTLPGGGRTNRHLRPEDPPLEVPVDAFIRRRIAAGDALEVPAPASSAAKPAKPLPEKPGS